MGGFLAQPARFYPHLFSPDGIFGEYPYLLPNLVSVVVIVIAIIQGVIFLEETNIRTPTPSRKPSRAQIQPNGFETANETTQLLHPRRRRESVLSTFSTAPGGGVTYVAESMAPLPMDVAFDLRRGSLASIGSLRLKPSVASLRLNPRPSRSMVRPVLPLEFPTVDNAIEDDGDDHTDKPEPIKAFNRDVIMWTIALVFQSYHSMGFYTLLPVYLLDDPRRGSRELDLQGGLGITLHEVGTYLATSSFMSLFFQGLVFTFFVAKLGVWKAAFSVTLLSPLIYLIVPFVSLSSNPGACIYPILALSSFTGVVAFPAFLIMLKNATPSPLVLGQVNGLAMSACSAARTVAPPLVGIFYSNLGSAGAWWSCAFVALAGILQFYLAPRPKDDEETIMQKAETAAEDAPPMADVEHN